MRQKLMLFAIFVICLAFVSATADAQEYYADIAITVQNTGLVEISGSSNHPDLQPQQSQEYTSKKGELWTLNISPEGTFSDFVYEIRFPPATSISYINVPNLLAIENEAGFLTISGTGTDEDFFAIVQYSFAEKENYDLYLILIIGIVIVLSIYLFSRFSVKSDIHISHTNRDEKPLFNINSLTDRQKSIYEILEKHPEGITQSEIQKLTGIPKASLSRNINSMARKGILAKEGKGMSNFLYLKKSAQK